VYISKVEFFGILFQLRELNLAVPVVLAATQEYLFETCIGDHDWGELETSMTEEQHKDVLKQLGKLVKQMHNIKTTGINN
jgi:hypothetical protein